MLEYIFSPYHVFLPINFNKNINKKPIIIMSGNKRCKNCDVPIKSFKIYCLSCKRKLKRRKIFTLNPPPPPPYNPETVINIPSSPPPPPPSLINLPSSLNIGSIQTNTISSLLAVLNNEEFPGESKT